MKKDSHESEEVTIGVHSEAIGFVVIISSDVDMPIFESFILGRVVVAFISVLVVIFVVCFFVVVCFYITKFFCLLQGFKHLTRRP